MRPIRVFSACSPRLPSFGLQAQPRLVSFRGGLLRRSFHIPPGKPLPGLSDVLATAFHRPDEEDPSFEDSHLSFMPGEVFKFGDDEYRIERKLRGRLFSRVWLATHQNKRNPAHSDHRFVALETFDDMFSERLSIDPKNNADLYHIHSLKVRQKEGVRGSGYCDRTFRVLLGPHLCIVKEPCGPTLAALQEMQPHRSFTLPVTKRIIKQTLLALDFMHTTMKRTHIGVNPHNIQVALLSPKHKLVANIQDHLDSNPPQMVYRSTWDRFRWWASERSTKTMKTQPLPAFGLSPALDNLEIRLGRCEYATSDKHLEILAKLADMTGGPNVFSGFNEFHAPLLLAAPEAIRGGPRPYSPPINIWAVGHLLFQCLAGGEIVYTNRVEFEGREVPDFSDFRNLCLSIPNILEERLRTFAHINEEMSDSDIQATCALLSRCFGGPSERPTAKQLLKDKWFQK
ncbi:hypothetical protein V8D89_014323 [Ganoderma adspersum]